MADPAQISLAQIDAVLAAATVPPGVHIIEITIAPDTQVLGTIVLGATHALATGILHALGMGERRDVKSISITNRVVTIVRFDLNTMEETVELHTVERSPAR